MGNSARRELEETIGRDHGLELLFLEREEIVVLLTMPENGPLCATFLGLPSVVEADLEDLVARARRAAAVVVRGWQQRARGKPYIELAAVRIGPEGWETEDVFQLEKINKAVSQGGRIVLEGPGGSGEDNDPDTAGAAGAAYPDGRPGRSGSTGLGRRLAGTSWSTSRACPLSRPNSWGRLTWCRSSRQSRCSCC